MADKSEKTAVYSANMNLSEDAARQIDEAFPGDHIQLVMPNVLMAHNPRGMFSLALTEGARDMAQAYYTTVEDALTHLASQIYDHIKNHVVNAVFGRRDPVMIDRFNTMLDDVMYDDDDGARRLIEGMRGMGIDATAISMAVIWPKGCEPPEGADVDLENARGFVVYSHPGLSPDHAEDHCWFVVDSCRFTKPPEGIARMFGGFGKRRAAWPAPDNASVAKVIDYKAMVLSLATRDGAVKRHDPKTGEAATLQ